MLGQMAPVGGHDARLAGRAEPRQPRQAKRHEGSVGNHARQCRADLAPKAGAWPTIRGMSSTFSLSFEPSQDKGQLRRQLQAERLAMLDRHQRAVHLQQVLRVWLVGGI